MKTLRALALLSILISCGHDGAPVAKNLATPPGDLKLGDCGAGKEMTPEGKCEEVKCTYVISSSLGDDLNPGTLQKPWKSVFIQNNQWRIHSEIKKGDTVCFREGNYSGQANLDVFGPTNPSKWTTFRNYPGEIPVFEDYTNDFAFWGRNTLSDFRLEGMYFKGYKRSPFACGWRCVDAAGNSNACDSGCNNIVIRNNVSDLGGQGSFGVHKSDNVLMEYNIGSRSGWVYGWGSNFDLHVIAGKNHMIRGNVSFGAVETSEYLTDGNGFIVDLPEYLPANEKAGATFDSNISFGNAGDGFGTFNAHNITMINNVSVYNQRHQTAGLPYSGFACEFCINAGGKTMQNHVYKNNIAVSSSNSPRQPYSVSGKFVGASEVSSNIWYKEGSSEVNPLLSDISNLDFRLKDGSPAIDKGTASGAPLLDIGFNFKCIKKMAKPGSSPYPGVNLSYPWIAYEPDFDYIKSLGEIKHCFKPKARPQGGGVDIGAYER